MSSNRIIVDTSVYDDFVGRFVARAKALKVGDPNEADTAIGPIINQRQLEAILRRLEGARSAGLTELLGGPPRGQVLPPHVFVDVPNDSDFAQAEQFGPVAMIIRAQDEADALRLANHTEYGLSSAVFTKNEERGVAFGLRIDAGMTHVNDSTINDDSNNMFGGEKNSGIGRFGGDWVLSEMTTDHWVTLQKRPAHYPF
jgi:aldehyde dehydrogenase (NAD+)